LLVEQITVLDRANPRLHRPDDRLRCVGMRHDIDARGLCLLDDRTHFLHRELGARDPVGGRRYPSRGHDLDVVRAFSDLVPRRAPHLRDTVANATESRTAEAMLDAT